MEKEKVETAEQPVEVTEVATQEPNAEVTEKVERTPRELFYERIRTSRPDAKYDDDEEEYFRQASAALDEHEKKSGEYDSMTQKLMSRFNSNPDEAEAFLDYLDGAPLPAAIRRRMGDEALSMKEGDEGWDEYVKAGEDRKAQHEESRKALDAFLANAKESDAVMSDFVSEHGMDEETAKTFTDMVLAVANDISAGRVTKDTLMMLKKARDYDSDIAAAREQGEVDGKNKKIEAEKKRMQGSGLPDAAVGGSAAEEVDAKTSNSTADWLKGFKR
jgi:hypothetical protein